MTSPLRLSLSQNSIFDISGENEQIENEDIYEFFGNISLKTTAIGTKKESILYKKVRTTLENLIKAINLGEITCHKITATKALDMAEKGISLGMTDETFKITWVSRTRWEG